MAFNPDDFEVKPIGDAGLTERTVLDGSERILVQGGPDENVDTTPMEFVKYNTIQAKIDTLKGTGWAGETVKGNADDITLKESIENVNTLKGTGWVGQTVKGNADAIALKESIENINTLKGTGWAGQTVKGNADAIAEKASIANVNTLKGSGWTNQTVKGNADAIATKIGKATPSVSVTASKTLGLTDASTLQICNSASSITITIPTNAVTAFPVGTEIVITRYGTGAVTIAGAVTIRSTFSWKSINPQYGVVSLYKIATDEWLLIGALS